MKPEKQQKLKRKFFFAAFLFFSFFCFAEQAQSQTSLQNLFFDAVKFSIKEIPAMSGAENWIKNLVKANKKNVKFFYSRKIAVFDKNLNLVSMNVAEFLNRGRLGETDCFYDENDTFTFFETETFADEKSENLKNFSGGWIEQAIALSKMPSKSENPNEKNPVNEGKNLLELLEQGDSRGREIFGTENQGENENPDEENGSENEKPSFSYARKDGTLRRFFYDGEGMSANVLDGNLYITRTYGNETFRKCFDSKYLLFREEKFSFDSSLKNTKLLAVKNYNYIVESSVPVSMTETQFDKNIEIETQYNAAGLAEKVKTRYWEEESGKSEAESGKTSKKNGILSKTGNLKSESKNLKDENLGEKQVEGENSLKSTKKFFDDKLEIYLYDEKNRVCEYELTTWNYRKNLLGRTVVDSLNTKYEYSYHDSAEDGGESLIPADYKYFENGELRMERVYSAPDDYSEKLVFSSGLYVETFYKDGVKKREIIYANGKESRRREFE